MTYYTYVTCANGWVSVNDWAFVDGALQESFISSGNV